LLSLRPKDWPPDVFARLAGILPFQASSWDQIEALGPDHVDAYWLNVGSWMGESTALDAELAVNAFVKRGRAIAALECVHSAIYWKQPISPELSIKVLDAVRVHLIATADSADAPKGAEKLDSYSLGNVFKTVQEEGSLTPEQVGKVEELEWFFLSILKHHGRPRFLLQELPLGRTTCPKNSALRWTTTTKTWLRMRGSY